VIVRLLIYVPVLFLIAIVICGQRHSTAAATLAAAGPRTLRWLWMSLALVLSMQAIEWLFID
jgi:hypothetical protein